MIRFHSKYLWKVGCWTISVLGLMSLLTLSLLKLTGEITAFCFLDNIAYGVYYFMLFIFGVVSQELGNIQVRKSNINMWYTSKFFACVCLVTEVEGLAQFALTYHNIALDLSVDDAAQPYVHTLLALAITRLVLLLLTITSALRYLNKVIQAKGYDSDIFGSAYTFSCDVTVIQFYLYNAYLYDFSLPMMLLTTGIVYLYYKHIRV